MKTLKDIAIMSLSAVVAAWLLNIYVIGGVQVSSSSMEQTLLAGDFVVVNKLRSSLEPSLSRAGFSLPLISSLRNVERGDVIVFTFPGDRDEFPARGQVQYVKRCVAIAGDTVEIRNGILIVNGKEEQSPHTPTFLNNVLDPRLYPPGAAFSLDFYGPLQVPKRNDVVYLTTENIKAWETFIKREGHSVEIVNEAIFIDGQETVSYTVERNYIFVLGDNRHHSYDSRFWGFVPEEHIIGEALMVYYSKSTLGEREAKSFLSSIRWDRIGKLVE